MTKLLKKLKTAFKLATNLRTTGALFQTSSKAVREVCKYVDPNQTQTIIELGAGHGNITNFILQKMSPKSTLYIFEINSDFCKTLNEIKDERLVIINDSAEFLDNYISNEVDCIVSTLPLTFIPDSVVTSILQKCKNQLALKGQMSQILYSTLHLKKYKTFFSNVYYRLVIGLPLEFIYHCKNERLK